MGSTGSGHLSDYSNYQHAVVGVTGGKGIVDECNRAVNTFLEDVETSLYYIDNGTIPPRGTEVILQFGEKRIVAITKDGKIVGNIPTSYNYLLTCLKEGYQYEGIVSMSREKPIPGVHIAVTPQKGE